MVTLEYSSFADGMSPEDATRYLDFLENGSQSGLSKAELRGIAKVDEFLELQKINYQGIINIRNSKNILDVGYGKPIKSGTSSTKRPAWRQSEIDAAKDFPEYLEQKSFLKGEEVPYGTNGSVRPDLYKDGFSIDVMNYKVETASGRNNLARNIEKQYYQRIDNLPAGTKQSVLIDMRGQNVSQNNLNALYNDIMERTNNGIKVRFKAN